MRNPICKNDGEPGQSVAVTFLRSDTALPAAYQVDGILNIPMSPEFGLDVFIA